MSIEARFTLCNMAVEAGARGSLIAPDEKAIEYVFARASDITEEQRKDALNYWETLNSDKDAEFEMEKTSTFLERGFGFTLEGCFAANPLRRLA